MAHQHKLQLNGSGAPSYMCSGCKELGFGSSYNCENSNCNYILHKECAEPIIHAVHPFFNNCTFEFYDKVQEGGFCDACGKDVLGFFYHCSQTGYALHPCCLNLQDKFDDKDGNVIMTLSQEVPSDCLYCKKRNVARNQFKGWSYVDNNDRKSCVHVSCFKDMILKTLNNRGETTTRSNGSSNSFLKFTGMLVFGLIGMFTGDISSIFILVEAIVSSILE